jgi:hypothetical protein
LISSIDQDLMLNVNSKENGGKMEGIVDALYNNCRKYDPIDLANLSTVIASGAKQSDAKHRSG